jgi:hypothetical protein
MSYKNIINNLKSDKLEVNEYESIIKLCKKNINISYNELITYSVNNIINKILDDVEDEFPSLSYDQCDEIYTMLKSIKNVRAEDKILDDCHSYKIKFNVNDLDIMLKYEIEKNVCKSSICIMNKKSHLIDLLNVFWLTHIDETIMCEIITLLYAAFDSDIFLEW